MKKTVTKRKERFVTMAVQFNLRITKLQLIAIAIQVIVIVL